jgi:hypothetical protein
MWDAYLQQRRNESPDGASDEPSGQRRPQSGVMIIHAPSDTMKF